MERKQTETERFAALFEQYREPFIRFACSYLRDRAAAEDIYVEAMAQYWEKRGGLPEDTNVPAYVLAAVKNKALNHLRHLDVRAGMEEELAGHEERELQFRISSLEACDPCGLFRDEISGIIRRTLDGLPRQTRAIFCRSRYGGRTNREIACELGVNVKTVEYHISKALKELRLRLKDYLPLAALLLPGGWGL